MNSALLSQVVNAVLYEGYVLYPYRASSKKNQRERFTFGRVYPPAYCAAQGGVEPCVMQTECLVRRTGERATLQVSVRFLHPMWREIGELAAPISESEFSGGAQPQFQVVPDLFVNGQLHQSWQEAVERDVALPPISLAAGSAKRIGFAFPASRTVTPLSEEGQIVAVMIRRQDALQGAVEVDIETLEASLYKVTVRILNLTPVTHDEVQDTGVVAMRTFASTHAILHTPDAEFISLLEPPPEYASHAESCHNIGVWPVLVGDDSKGERDTMLASPIILYDYPQIAPESAGDFYDGTEMDEMLALRVLTMTDQEKHEMRSVDGIARGILERTENLRPEQFMKMHGTLRDVRAAEGFFNPAKPLTGVVVKGVEVKAGDQFGFGPNTVPMPLT